MWYGTCTLGLAVCSINKQKGSKVALGTADAPSIHVLEMEEVFRSSVSSLKPRPPTTEAFPFFLLVD